MFYREFATNQFMARNFCGRLRVELRGMETQCGLNLSNPTTAYLGSVYPHGHGPVRALRGIVDSKMDKVQHLDVKLMLEKYVLNLEKQMEWARKTVMRAGPALR